MDRFSQMLSQLAVTSLGDTSIQAMLDRVAAETAGVLPVDGAGVVLHGTAAAPPYLAASDPVSLRFERLQSSLAQGPRVVATHSMAPVSVADLTLEEGFPAFASAVHDMGLRGVFAFPLRLDDVSLGALDLYRFTPGRLDDDQMLAARTLADVLSAYVVNARTRAMLEATSNREHSVAARLQALDDERNDFVAVLAHEIGTPIAGIAGFAELLEDASEALSDQQRDFVSAIRRNSDRLRTLAADLLTLFSLDPRDAHRDHTEVDLRTVVAAAGSVLAPAYPTLAVDVAFHVPERPVLVRGDPHHLERMLSNLLNNAVKYTPRGGTVSCVVRRHDGHATLEVRDTGIGIPEEERGKLFTRFFRASTARELGIGGTGLGLAIVKTVVDSHAGTIEVSSTVGSGTRFLVRLPAVETHGSDAGSENAHNRELGPPSEA